MNRPRGARFAFPVYQRGAGRRSLAKLNLALLAACIALPAPAAELERIVVAENGTDFVHAKSNRPFRPWGVNYGNRGRLMEDFWDDEWSTIEGDFREIRQLGGNVVRVHLQFGRFMEAADVPNRKALQRLERLVTLAESTGLYLDLTGLACYRPSDVPPWYDALDDTARWHAQANFWRAVAEQCANRPGIFCYDLMNEPIAPAGKTEKWYSGKLLGGYDFIQLIARDPAGRSRSETAIAWIKELTAAIREKDRTALVTVGMLPWVTNWKHLSGFVPKEIAPHVDFLSVHIYPKSKLPEEARTALKECAGQKPVVIEETFPLECSIDELAAFLRESRAIASGWIFHYDGSLPEEYDALERAGEITVAQRIWRDALRLFVELRAAFTVLK